MKAKIEQPVTDDICEEEFISPADGSRQTYLLAGAGSAESPVPLLAMYLHGGLNHQEQGMTAWSYNNFFGRMWKELANRRAVYACPEYRGNSWMGPAAEADVLYILQNLRKRFQPGKVFLFGGSMGGTSTLIFACRHAAQLDAVLALCPATDMTEIFRSISVSQNTALHDLADECAKNYGGSPDQVPQIYRERSSRLHVAELSKLPIAIVHGSADEIIPVGHSRTIVTELEKAGARYEYVELEGGDHDSPLVHFDIGEILNFLLPGTD